MPHDIERARLVVRGAVQGVGFRPFIYRLAKEADLTGWVLNSAQGVFIEVEGSPAALRQFVVRVKTEKPPRAMIQSMESTFVSAVGYQDFEIRYSDQSGAKSVLISPDIATCADCRREVFCESDRRHRYPFTNCTNCGPRFTIIEGLPYDRANTAMKKFAMCAECEREYHDPADRRFHAQPNACPRCGPQLELWDATGNVIARKDEALLIAASVVQDGKILALKGMGGFQLIVDARSETAVSRLRERKHREEKPFALMSPSLEAVREICFVSELEERLLLSPEAPIVLMNRRPESQFALSIAPRNPWLGVMLPCTPLHHLFLHELDFPIVATSGNLSDEPICIDETEALERLRGIADFFLVHDRPIVRYMDDSVVRVVCGREMVLRRARGYAPLPVHVKEPLPSILGVGAHLKNTVALSVGTEIFISQHIGDLETGEAHSAFLRVAADLPRLYDAKPEWIACDMHPDYLSTKYAMEGGAPATLSGASQSAPGSRELACPGVRIQHHWAHVAACMAENEIAPPALGVAWDGTGYGPDGTVWGGEFLLAQEHSFSRVAHFRQFRLAGGETAIKEPRRCALGVLHGIFGDELWERRDLTGAFSEKELPLLRQMLAKKINAPLTSSAGRFFDAVASIAGLRQCVSFEGQAAMELEFAIEAGVEEAYPFDVQDGSPRVIDWRRTILEVVNDVRRNKPVGMISAKFHNMLVEVIVATAREIGELRVVLTGGCFQNKYLTERTVQRLLGTGFRPSWHQRIPPNDGGIALGQIAAAGWAARDFALNQ